MIHLRSFSLRRPPEAEAHAFPFSLPVVQSLEGLEFNAPVTLFVGENGSGKSTLLEALACAVGSITVGSESVKTDPTLAAVRRLADRMHLVWQKRIHRGFFLRAEDFFGYARRMAQERLELEDDLRSTERDYQDRSATAAAFARLPYANEINEMQRLYGEGLDVRSHGESFLTLLQSRFVPGGLYLLDEPEAPLSPIRQLALIAALKQMVALDSQVIIATHSPILMAFPGACIYNFDVLPPQTVRYADLEHVKLTRDFLDNPDAFLKHL